MDDDVMAGHRGRLERTRAGSVKFWGRDWAYVSDEVYGTATGAGHGCPWGWARMIDISDPRVPTVEAEYKLPENDPSTYDDWNPPRTSYSAHNPTLTPHIAFSTWHSGGRDVELPDHQGRADLRR